MSPLALIIAPVPHGWAVALTDGRELARFSGLGARWRAMRYLNGYTHGLRAARG
jgi:hypothetical protein